MKLAWVRSGNSSTLVSIEQLRAATGFEGWSPSEEDIKALKDSKISFEEHMLKDLEDETGPQPPQHTTEGDIQPLLEPPPTMMAIPPTPARSATPLPEAQPTITTIQQLSSPTYHQHNVQQQRQHTTNIYHSYGKPPAGSRTPRTPRRGSYKPTLPTTNQPQRARPSQELLDIDPLQATQPPTGSADPILPDNQQPEIQSTGSQPQPQLPRSDASNRQSKAASEPRQSDGQQVSQTTAEQQQVSQQPQEQPETITTQREQHADTTDPVIQQPLQSQSSSTPQEEQATGMDQSELPLLPMKRPFEAMSCSLMLTDDGIELMPTESDGTTALSYGPQHKQHFVAYTRHPQRQQEVKEIDIDPNESDTTQESDSEAEQPQHINLHNNDQSTSTTHNLFQHKSSTSSTTDNFCHSYTDTTKHNSKTHVPPHQRLTRQEAKQLDREIPWRELINLPPIKLQKYLAAIEKEAMSWLKWKSITPLSREEARKVLADKILAKRVLRARAAYRGKNRGQGEVKAKCRIVALGHRDPNIFLLQRTSPTPTRTTEHILLCCAVAGMNKEFDNTGKSWLAWTGDAQTAFLQGTQQDACRPLPLYMFPPVDGLIDKTNCWKSPLYRVEGNIYGLPNAPFLWTLHVTKILVDKLGYIRHSWDCMLLIMYDQQGSIMSMVMVYVDDFIGIYREDYDINEVHSAFKWGDLGLFQLDEPKTFKGKEITFTRNAAGRVTMRISMAKFLETVEPMKIVKGRLQQDPPLSEAERKDYRSLSGCLQWLASQARPELCPAVSLSNRGASTTIQDLKTLQDALEFAKQTPDRGITFQDVPVDKDSVLLTYTDASWNNAASSTSQLGILVVLTTPQVTDCSQRVSILDWRSCRSPRVCRSTLAAEACVGDEGADRSAFINMHLSEILHQTPAHRVGCKLNYFQITDAKSLYDSVISPNPSLSDKRSMVNIRAMQESLSASQYRWVPTLLMFADGLTKISTSLRQTMSDWLQ